MLASKFSKVFSGCYAGGSCFHKHFRNKETRTFCLSFCFNTVILVFFLSFDDLKAKFHGTLKMVFSRMARGHSQSRVTFLKASWTQCSKNVGKLQQSHYFTQQFFLYFWNNGSQGPYVQEWCKRTTFTSGQPGWPCQGTRQLRLKSTGSLTACSKAA